MAEEGKETRVTAPESVSPGAVEIRFTNSGKRDHSVQIIRVGDGHTGAEVKKAGDAWAAGQAAASGLDHLRGRDRLDEAGRHRNRDC